jgi:hypothetical protein
VHRCLSLLVLAGVLIVITLDAHGDPGAHVSYVLDLPSVRVVVRT